MSTITTGSRDDVNDETPLLQNNGSDLPQKPTPLPTSQILIVLSERLCDLTALSSIDPYINQVRVSHSNLTRYAAHNANAALS